MSTIDNLEGSGPYLSFNTGDATLSKEKEEQKGLTKGNKSIANVPANRTQTGSTKDKGVQYLVLSVVGYVCASIVFGFLLNKRGKESNTSSSE